MDDLVTQALIDRLIETPAVAAIVGANVRKGHLAAIAEATYPVVTLTRRTGGRREYAAPYGDFPLTLVATTTESALSWQLSEVCVTALDRTTGTSNGRTWAAFVDTTPFEVPEIDTERLYHVVTLLRIRQLN